MFFLSPDETLAALTAAFLGGALFGRIVWRRQAYEGRIRTAADALLQKVVLAITAEELGADIARMHHIT